MVEVKD